VLGQSNTYGFGRLGWEPSTSSEEIHSDWAKQTFGLAQESQAGGLESVVSIMEDGWEVYENCTCSSLVGCLAILNMNLCTDTSPLGLGFVVSGGYGGGPCMGQAAYDSHKPFCHPAACHNSRDGACPKVRRPASLLRLLLSPR